jgi:hypothetical protein
VTAVGGNQECRERVDSIPSISGMPPCCVLPVLEETGREAVVLIAPSCRRYGCPWSGWPAADGTLARYAPRRGCTVGEIMYPIRWVTHLSPSEQGNMCCGWEPGRPDFSLASVEARNLYAANGSTKLAGMAAKHRWSTWAGRVSHRAQSFG